MCVRPRLPGGIFKKPFKNNVFLNPRQPARKGLGLGLDLKHNQGLGLGLRVALNDTFIVAFDAAVPVDPEMDGPGVKLYVGLDWLF